MATKWFHMVAIVLAVSPLAAAFAETDADRRSEERAIGLFMDGCVQFGPAPIKRSHWLNEAGLLPVKIETKGMLWAFGPHDGSITLLAEENGVCSVMLANIDPASVAGGVPRAFETVGLPLQRIALQPRAGFATNDLYRTIVGRSPFDVHILVMTPPGPNASSNLRAVLAFGPSAR